MAYAVIVRFNTNEKRGAGDQSSKGEGMEEKSTSRQEEAKRGSRLCEKNQSDVEKGMCRNIMLGSSTRGVTD